jgi:hypothetical protein
MIFIKKLRNIIIFSILLFFSLFFIFGCTTKEIPVIKYKYIEKTCPKLKIYDFNKSLELTIKKDKNKICIKEWGSCIKEEEFYKLVRYIKELKLINEKYKNEIKLYNQKFGDK